MTAGGVVHRIRAAPRPGVPALAEPFPRRSSLGVLAACLLPAAHAAAQPGRPRRLAVILATAEGDTEGEARIAALREGLRAAGLAEPELRIEPHFTRAEPERAARIAAAVVAARPDAILVAGGTAITAVLRETRSIPVVFQFNADPVAAGMVAAMAHPGGNATGFTSFEPRIVAKWIQLLRQAAPGLRRIRLLAAENPTGAQMQGLEVAPDLDLGVLRFASDRAVREAISATEAEGAAGLVLLPSGAALARRDLIIGLANAARLPAIYPLRAYAERGGLLSYSPDLLEQYRQAGAVVARILRGGDRPGELPVQAPTRFELALNLSTARAIGLELPASLVAAADHLLD